MSAPDDASLTAVDMAIAAKRFRLGDEMYFRSSSAPPGYADIVVTTMR
jgi:hypothetical protein